MWDFILMFYTEIITKNNNFLVSPSVTPTHDADKP
jgi:hypothetical protein